MTTFTELAAAGDHGQQGQGVVVARVVRGMLEEAGWAWPRSLSRTFVFSKSEVFT
jgi:hypothetical protein